MQISINNGFPPKNKRAENLEKRSFCFKKTAFIYRYSAVVIYKFNPEIQFFNLPSLNQKK